MDEQKARRPYELRDEFQKLIDYARGGSIGGDSDLTVQILLAEMERKNPSESYISEVKTKTPGLTKFELENRTILPVIIHLEKLDKLRNLCEKIGGHRIEYTLKTPEDIEYAIQVYRM